MKLKTLKTIKNLKNKRVLVRVGFDCPTKNGRVVDDSRIQQALLTIEYLAKHKAKVILITHLGRPFKNQKSKIKNQNYSLKPIYKYLKSEIQSLKFVDDCIGPKVEKVVKQMKPGEVVLLENLRFYPQEQENDLRFAKKLADLADIYVNEAFSNSHRLHSSMQAITKYLPSYAGFALEKEIKYLSQFLLKPKHPLIVIIGGKKITTKLNAIKNLLKLADQVLIGGAVASNFFKASGYKIGKSFFEPKMIKTVQGLLKNKKIILPFDVKVSAKGGSASGGKTQKRSLNLNIGELNNLSNNFEILDIGPGTTKMFEKYIKSAKMIIWNGPMGYFEDKVFSQGTKAITAAVFNNNKAKIIIGGGETIAALKKFKVYSLRFKVRDKNRVFVSTGGGAMLEFLSGKELPGIKPLLINNKK
ncbi:phosphoglycerate kinase [Patescibacteria group bacterium]|nr:phosphoglycerate kinase [Patescibacteria group bacterium]